MPDVVFSEQAAAVHSSLETDVRIELQRRIDYLSSMPRLYPATCDDRFPGCRTFWLDPCYRVFYLVASGEDDVYLVAIVEEEVCLLES